MQYVVERIADRASALGAAVRRVALVDRRSMEEQRREPYALGEAIALDAPVREVED